MEKFKSLFLQNRNLKQTMFKNVFWMFVSQISRILRVITLLYAARVLGASEYGVFSYILGIVGLFSIFADMGINPLLTRDTTGNPQTQKEYFVTSFWIKMFLIIFTSTAFLIFAPYFTKIQSAVFLIPLAAFLIVFDNIRDFIVAYLRGLQKMERETLIVTILNIVLASLGIFTLWLYPNAKDFFFVYVVSSAIATLAALIIGGNNILHIFNGFRKNIAIQIFQNGWPIALSGAFGMIMINMDIFMLGFWRTPAEIGFYAAGQKIIQVLYTIPALLASGTFPTLASIIKNDEVAKERNLNEKSISVIFLFTIPLVIGGIILANPIFKLFFGHEYVEGVPAFIVLLLNTLLIFPGVIISNLVLAHNQQKITFKYIMLATIINMILNFILIPKIGIIGAALATLAAQAIYLGFTLLVVKKISHFTILPYLKKIIISGLCMGAVSFYMDRIGIDVLFNIVVSALWYLIILIILKEETVASLKIFLQNLTVEEK